MQLSQLDVRSRDSRREVSGVFRGTGFSTYTC